jgi:hypothetical protein
MPEMTKRLRKLTPFLCQEMLYDYAIDRLDPERKRAVEEFLKTDKGCQETLDGIYKAIRYGESLAHVEPNPEILEHISESENIASLGRRYSSWKEWPDVMRWAIVCLLLVVSVAGVVSAVPWKRLNALSQKRAASDSIEITTLQGPNGTQIFSNSENAEADAAALAAVESSGDEEMDGSNDVAGDGPGEEAAAPPVATAPSKSATASPHVVTQPAPPAASVKAPAVVAVAPTPGTVAGADSVASAKDAKGKGFVYRAFMTLSNLEELGPKITTDVEGLGAQKAGEVELGWKRGTGRYYHFTMPEANEEKLLERLRAYGPVRISKDPHPRVMPQGQVRFILWVESGT